MNDIGLVRFFLGQYASEINCYVFILETNLLKDEIVLIDKMKNELVLDCPQVKITGLI